MDKGLLLLIGASLASAAFAQPQRDAQIRAQSDLRSSEYEPGASRYAATRDERDKLECLIRKSDKIRVCHTRERWRAIAQQFGREEALKR